MASSRSCSVPLAGSAEPLALAGHADGAVGAYVVALGQDDEGELYVLTSAVNKLSGTTGKVFKLAPQ